MCVIRLMLEELEACPQEPAHATQIKWVSNQNTSNQTYFWSTNLRLCSYVHNCDKFQTNKKTKACPGGQSVVSTPPLAADRKFDFPFFPRFILACLRDDDITRLLLYGNAHGYDVEADLLVRTKATFLKLNVSPHLKSQKHILRSSIKETTRHADATPYRWNWIPCRLCTLFFQTDTLHRAKRVSSEDFSPPERADIPRPASC